MKYIGPLLKKADNKVTVALSMGCDSLAIAHFIKTKLPFISLSAFHFNHNLREQNHVMADAAQKFCSDFNIPLTTKIRDDSSDSVSEASLRKVRYSNMENMGYVITGHHLDDCCENYLYNCFNGVPQYLPIPLCTQYTDVNNLTIIRPFMLNTKDVFCEYIKENELEKYLVEDETNTDEKYKRNWLRHNLLPQINGRGYNIQTIVRKMYGRYIKDNL